MKALWTKYGMISALIVLVVAIFSFGGMYSRYMTNEHDQFVEENDIRKEEERLAEIERQKVASFVAMVDGADSAEKFTASSVSKPYLLGDNNTLFRPTIEESYKLLDGTTVVGVVYVINSNGKNPGLKLAVAVDSRTDAVSGVLVIDQDETPDYYSKLNSAFFSQFDNLAFDQIVLEIDSVAGATYSSRGFEIAVQYAREVYAKDFTFTIPTITVAVLSVTVNTDPLTFGTSPFIASITYGLNNTPATVYLSAACDYNGIVGGGADIDLDSQTALKSLASAKAPRAYFVSYDSVTGVLVMKTNGYAGTITVTVTLNAEKTAMASFVVSSNETYKNEYNPGYTGGNPPAAENAMMNQYMVENTVNVDAVAGASEGTWPAMKALIQILDGFISDLNGGN